MHLEEADTLFMGRIKAELADEVAVSKLLSAMLTHLHQN